jgi:hypothetical protein
VNKNIFINEGFGLYIADMNACFAVPKQKICQKYLALGASTRVDLIDLEDL